MTTTNNKFDKTYIKLKLKEFYRIYQFHTVIKLEAKRTFLIFS
ncbi:hypothetical protein THF1D04_300033 [Vibrio owensii]|uniref:Uncharacterized protein n=1 Tax=Vibrio owensii TaxID=696485 RepID=A0AAU9Q862_9VIBR|nr:hypothetical protein THF1D04_300033 [Vibrio owensii]